MPSLDDIARFQTALAAPDIEWLHALVTDWQIIADLAFSDGVLWVADAESKGTWACAQIRPTTGPTTLIEDLVGTFVPAGGEPELERVLSDGKLSSLARGGGAAAESEARVQIAAVRRADRVIAALALRSPAGNVRPGSSLETAYRESADLLVSMIGAGEFPDSLGRGELADTLRVGDGFIRLDVNGIATYASPNAMSAYRRLGISGDLVGSNVADLTARVDARPTHRASAVVLAGRESGEMEVENAAAAAAVRVIALRRDSEPAGAIMLLRDVTELRLRERELLSKDATIREIHHRVKNNLQTVAALLRLQSRRVDLPEARAALEEAVRRVGSIAVVHETLSQTLDQQVEFDAIADRLLNTVLEVGGSSIKGERIGTFGSLSGEQATALAMVLTELVQNAAEHAYPDQPGRVRVAANRIRDRLRIRVSDEGVGLPENFDPTASLGLSIVSTLVEGELGGTLEFTEDKRGGTTVSISMTL